MDKIAATNHPSLKEAHKIIKRLDNGDFYLPIAEWKYKDEFKDIYDKLTPEKVVSYSSSLDVTDIRIIRNKFNYALGSKNPLDHVLFYSE